MRQKGVGGSSGGGGESDKSEAKQAQKKKRVTGVPLALLCVVRFFSFDV